MITGCAIAAVGSTAGWSDSVLTLLAALPCAAALLISSWCGLLATSPKARARDRERSDRLSR